jgi:hypothetical protein
VGERLRAPLRLVGRPVGLRVRGPSPACAIVVFDCECPHSIPAGRAVRKEERSTKLFASPASTDRHATHLSTGAFSAPRMRTRLGPSRSSSSLHRMPSISDALVVTRRHARVGLLTARCAARDTLLADGVTWIDLRAEGPCFARPVRARTGKSPRASSVVSRTCKLSAAGWEHAITF